MGFSDLWDSSLSLASFLGSYVSVHAERLISFDRRELPDRCFGPAGLVLASDNFPLDRRRALTQLRLKSLIGAMQSGESFLGLLTRDDTGRATIWSAGYGSVNSASCSEEIGPGAIHC